MRRNQNLLLLCALLCGNVLAADGDVDRLAKSTEQYARCLDNTLGNFSKDEEAKLAARKISGAMLRNIRAIVTDQRMKPNSKSSFWIETLGDEVFVGYLFKSFSDVREEYQVERRRLNETNSPDWRKTHRQLWAKYGCDAIYLQLSR